MIPLGPFELLKQIGRGGMCEVWEGRHRTQEVPVAVKIIRQAKWIEEEHFVSFEEEARSLARLQHPSIVTIYDCGEIPEETERISKGSLPEGCPYLVMELAETSLAGFCGKLPFQILVHFLYTLLDALAYAHARGMIHRDIKPANVLFWKDEGYVKLSDFGVVHSLEKEDAEEEDGTLIGTKAYMAPEQFRGTWRDFGPWTDLYALGCTAYALLTGEPPFGAKGSMWQMMLDHTTAPVPKLPKHMKVKEGFEGWLLKLLQKEPGHRFQHAREASLALRNIMEGESLEMQGSISHLPGMLPSSSERTGMFLAELMDLAVEMADSSDTDPGGSDTLNLGPKDTQREKVDWSQDNPEAPLEITDLETRRFADTKPSMESFAPLPIPEGWRKSRASHQRLLLDGVGLGLYSIRSMPLIGREQQKEKLWEVLRGAHERRETQLVLLEGEAGSGKSSLARWLCESASELGVAHAMKATHNPRAGSGDGLEVMLARHLRCLGLNREKLLERLQLVLTREGIHSTELPQALMHLLLPTLSDESAESGYSYFSSMTERYTALVQFIQGVTHKRSMIIWLDNIQWGFGSLHFAHHLMKIQQHTPVPLILLLTARSEALEQFETCTQMLDELMEMPNTTRIGLPHLSKKEHRDLVRNLLGLEKRLARQVEKRSAGNPLFAIQLVDDWVRRGLLELSPRGFRLRKGADVQIPDDLYLVWLERIEALQKLHGESGCIALEIAAALGAKVVYTEWQVACAIANVEITPAFFEYILRQRLIELEEGSRDTWSFTHDLLRESLERIARENGRLQSHHQACAEMLITLQYKKPDVNRRWGRHLVEAGETLAAIEPLRRDIQSLFRMGSFRLAKHLLDDLQKLIVPVQEQLEPEIQVELLILEYNVLIGFGHRVETDIEKAVKIAREHELHELLIRALLYLAKKDWVVTGHYDTAQQHFEEAAALAEEYGFSKWLSEAHLLMGDFFMTLGRWKEARTFLLRAHQAFQKAEAHQMLGRCFIQLARLSRRNGDLEQNQFYNKQAHEHYVKANFRKGIADCFNAMGEVSRYLADFEQAENHYREAMRMYTALGSVANLYICKLNLALVLFEKRHFPQALEMARSGYGYFGKGSHQILQLASSMLLFQCLVGVQAWEESKTYLALGEALSKIIQFYDLDLAKGTYQAAILADRAGQWELARRAYTFSLEQWRVQEDQERILEIEAALQTIAQQD